jgi:hypothetical protein
MSNTPQGFITGPGFDGPVRGTARRVPSTAQPVPAPASNPASAEPDRAPASYVIADDAPRSTALASPRSQPRAPEGETLCSVSAALEAEAEAPDEPERILRRLALAVLALIVIAPLAIVGLDKVGVELPPELALAIVAVLGAGAVMTALGEPRDEAKAARRRAEAMDDARPVGCCQGPRPMKCFKGEGR